MNKYKNFASTMRLFFTQSIIFFTCIFILSACEYEHYSKDVFVSQLEKEGMWWFEEDDYLLYFIADQMGVDKSEISILGVSTEKTQKATLAAIDFEINQTIKRNLILEMKNVIDLDHMFMGKQVSGLSISCAGKGSCTTDATIRNDGSVFYTCDCGGEIIKTTIVN
ncbi:hypothetical protein [Sediminitomix flava]|uniref:Lipoprotein n=1 Tax=Sediminitomix flava TaxID=379075 RepID=A0A315ZI53_SEDFL|nr:hypothetical protein [Sediminitomix flava]PWJ44498.1 hypothetical protein BC781_101869 [Sediminitomix flava]